jgi:hypothetical protein
MAALRLKTVSDYSRDSITSLQRTVGLILAVKLGVGWSHGELAVKSYFGKVVVLVRSPAKPRFKVNALICRPT